MSYFDQHGHLNDEAISLYAEALKSNEVTNIPAAVQQHIDECMICHQQALDMFGVIAQMDYSELGALKKPGARIIALRRIRQIAAAAAIIAGLAWMIHIWTRPPAGRSTVDHQLVKKDSTQVPVLAPDTTAIARQEKQLPLVKKQPEHKGNAQLAENDAHFIPSDALEGLIAGTMRGEETSIVAPLAGKIFRPGQAIDFKWATDNTNRHWLVIMDNREKEVFRQEVIQSEFQFMQALPPGRYYWKLEDPSDLICIGWFLIR